MTRDQECPPPVGILLPSALAGSVAHLETILAWIGEESPEEAKRSQFRAWECRIGAERHAQKMIRARPPGETVAWINGQVREIRRLQGEIAGKRLILSVPPRHSRTGLPLDLEAKEARP